MVLANAAWPQFVRRYSTQSDLLSYTLSDFSQVDGPSRETLSLATTLSYRASLEKNEQEIVKHFLLVPVYRLMDELKLMTSIISPFAVPHAVSDLQYKSLEQRFGNVAANYAETRLGSKYSDVDKLQKEVAVMLFLLENLVNEVKNYDSVGDVREYLNNIFGMKRDEEILMEELKEKRKLHRQLRQAVCRERQLKGEAVSSCDDAIKMEVTLLGEETERGPVEAGYCRRWERARYDQNKIMLEKKEQFQLDTVLHQRLKIDMENRCHQNIQDFLLEWQQDSADQIDAWMKTYETTLEAKESKVYNLKIEIEKLNDELEAVKRLYKDRAQEIQEYSEYKRKKKEEEILLRLQNRAAVKIQIWWRGVMVRKGLGPHKTSKKNKKGTKSRQRKTTNT